jgi:hypothetical protein
MATRKAFRIGSVTVYLRSKTWYLRYRENGRRRQVRAAVDKQQSRQLAAQLNAQLAVGAPAQAGCCYSAAMFKGEVPPSRIGQLNR